MWVIRKHSNGQWGCLDSSSRLLGSEPAVNEFVFPTKNEAESLANILNALVKKERCAIDAILDVQYIKEHFEKIGMDVSGVVVINVSNAVLNIARNKQKTIGGVGS